MSHEITFFENRPQIAVAGDCPWHKLGHHEDRTHFESLAELQEVGGVLCGDYGIEKIYNSKGIAIPGHRVVAWQPYDTNKPVHYVGTVTDRYKNITVEQIADLMTPAQDAGLAKLQTGMLLRNASRVALSYEIELPESLFPDSESRMFVSLVSDNNGTGSLWPCYSAIRTVCDNTASLNIGQFGQNGLSDVLRKISHKGDVKSKLEDLQAALSSVVAGGIEAGKLFRKMADHEITNDDLKAFMTEMIPLPEEPGKARTQAENRRELFRLSYFDSTTENGDKRHTAYRLYNAATHLVNHQGGVATRGKDPQDRFEKKLDSLLFGQGDKFMAKALSLTSALVS